MENIAIVTGGDSSEHDISLKSANNIKAILDDSKYKGFLVLIKENNLYVVINKNKIEIDKSDFSFIYQKRKKYFNKVFMALHGPPAENGVLQKYLDKLNIEYSACNSEVSEVTFNKYECNKKLKKLGFLCSKSILINNKNINTENIIEKIPLPFFVKPNTCGSSFGVSKVKFKKQLKKALDTAFNHSNEVIIEKALSGIEIGSGIFFDGNKIIALPLTEIKTKNDFFDFAAKYNGESEEYTPARINNEITQSIKNTSIEVYKKMKLKGICRIDYILENHKPYIIEINTIPGFTNESIIPQQIQAANLDFKEIINLCLANTKN